ncbi:hypothetical protein [Paeniglutamicibacter sulfureus]|uniref:Tail tape measure protein n=1 Tax=Paeniglutamicibacter sulfureus TaxID=43666 RepID=A0ABU2BJS0_9MICC|nr:hypothetical protein [Paeniglutamicibacter sulfureus]MDR7358481.1 hypothetical protein [Paeniglutamicibacter sulfureus]
MQRILKLSSGNLASEAVAKTSIEAMGDLLQRVETMTTVNSNDIVATADRLLRRVADQSNLTPKAIANMEAALERATRVTSMAALERLQGNLDSSRLVKSSLFLDNSRMYERLVTGVLAAYVKQGGLALAIETATRLAEREAGAEVDEGVFVEAEELAADEKRVGEVIGIKDFSWESESDLEALDSLGEQIRVGGGWQADFIARVTELWIGRGFATSNAPRGWTVERLGTLVTALSLMTLYVVGIPAVERAAAEAAPVAQVVAKGAADAAVASVELAGEAWRGAEKVADVVREDFYVPANEWWGELGLLKDMVEFGSGAWVGARRPREPRKLKKSKQPRRAARRSSPALRSGVLAKRRRQR